MEIMQLLFSKKVFIVLVRASIMEAVSVFIALRGSQNHINHRCDYQQYYDKKPGHVRYLP
jgi:hypothetical protein